MLSRITALALVAASPNAIATGQDYKPAGDVPLGAPDRWDYTIFDAGSSRVYVAHGDRLTVADSLAGRVVGQVEGMAGGTHGIAIVGTRGKGYTDDGRAGEAVSFDLKTLAVIAHIPAETDADAMVLDPKSGNIFVIEGDPATITVIDPRTDKAIGVIEVGEKLEYAAVDDRGALFVAGEEKGDVVRIDLSTGAVTAHWPAADCRSPHGLAYDPAGRRLFLGCANAEMIVLDASNGRVVASLPIGRGNDAVVFDPVRRRIFSSNGIDGTISVYRQLSPNRYEPRTSIRTRVSARTMTLDPATGRLFVPAADTDPSTSPNGRPKPCPGTLRLLMFDPVR